MRPDAPSVRVGLGRKLGDPGTLADSLSEAIAAELHGLFETLGIPWSPRVELGDSAGPELVSLSISDRRCPYPASVLKQAYGYSRGSVHDVETDEIASWWSSAAAASEADAVRFIALCCREIVARRPDMGLVPDALDHIRSELDPGHDFPEGWLGDTLALPLRLGISLADRGVLEASVAAALERGIAAPEAGEMLVSALRPETVGIRIAPATLERLTCEDESDHRQFAKVREALYDEIGVGFPAFAMELDERIDAGCFAFRLNHVVRLPRAALPRGHTVVNLALAAVEARGMNPSRVFHPVSGEPHPLLPLDEARELREEGVWCWDGISYLALCLGADLRRYAHCFVHRSFVEETLDEVRPWLRPTIDAALEKRNHSALTGCLRRLVREGAPIRDVRRVLERVIDFETISCDTTTNIVIDDRIPKGADSTQSQDGLGDLVASVRIALGEQIVARINGDAVLLDVFQLDPDLEQAIRSERGAEPAFRDAIARAVAGERTSAERRNSPILTTLEVRSRLQEILEPVMPRAIVLAYQELPPTLRLQVTSRIEMKAVESAIV